MQQQLSFRQGEYVSVSGRVGRIRGREPVDAAGARHTMLTIEILGLRASVVRIPLGRVESAVGRLGKLEAISLLADPPTPAPTKGWQIRRSKGAAAAMQRQPEFGRLGGLTKARNRRRVA